MKERNKLDIRCSKCNSKLIYIRIKAGEVVCRNCGHIFRFLGTQQWAEK